MLKIICDRSDPFRDIGSVHPVATRDDEAIFATYVNCIVLAIVYAAAEGVTQQYSADMPAMTLFGKHVSLYDMLDQCPPSSIHTDLFDDISIFGP